MARLKWRSKGILHRQLCRFRCGFSHDLSDEDEAEIDAGRDAATCNAVTITNDPLIDRLGSDEWQQVHVSPVSSGTVAVEKTCRTEHECASANRSGVRRGRRVRPKKR